MSTVIVYENIDFNGKDAVFGLGDHDGSYLREKIGVDCISSLKVPEGIQVEAFSGQHYDGKSFIFHYGEYSNLKSYDWNDDIGSMKVKEAPLGDQLVTVYTNDDCTGKYQRFPFLPNDECQKVAFNDAIQSIHIPLGLEVTLYEDYDCGGDTFPKKPKNKDDEKVNLNDVDFGNKCSSIKVTRDSVAVRLIKVDYHLENKVPKKSKELVRVSQTLVNNSVNASVQAPISYSETVGWEITSSWESALMIGASISVESEFNIPLIGKSKVSLTVSTEFTHTWGHNETSSGETTFIGGLEVELPPKSGAVEAITTIFRESYEVPYTATVEIIATGEIREENGTLLAENSFDVQTKVKDKLGEEVVKTNNGSIVELLSIFIIWISKWLKLILGRSENIS